LKASPSPKASLEEGRQRPTRPHSLPERRIVSSPPHQAKRTRGSPSPTLRSRGLFRLFESYTWHLDDTPGGKGTTPSIPSIAQVHFENYINQKNRCTTTPAGSPPIGCGGERLIASCSTRISLPASLAVTNDGSPSGFKAALPISAAASPPLRLLPPAPDQRALPSRSRCSGSSTLAQGTFHGRSPQGDAQPAYGSIVPVQPRVSADASVQREIVAGWRREHQEPRVFLEEKIITENLTAST
jgi:hypothetical protein